MATTRRRITRREILGPDASIEADLLERPGRFARLAPGEDLVLVEKLPRHHHGHLALYARPDEVVVDAAWHRTRCRVPRTAAGSTGHLPRAKRAVLILIRHRPVGATRRPLRYLLLLDVVGRTIARLDYSDGWEMGVNEIDVLCRLAGLTLEVQHYSEEAELLATHPDWVTPTHEFEIEHPGEEVVREFGLGLWWGVAIAGVLLGGISGVTFLFQAPVSDVVDALMMGGGLIAAGIGLWARSSRRKAWDLRRLARAANSKTVTPIDR